jgi:hypothetical protein
VVEIKANFERSFDDIVGLAALHIDDQADATVFMFILRVVKSLSFGRSHSFVHIDKKLGCIAGQARMALKALVDAALG